MNLNKESTPIIESLDNAITPVSVSAHPKPTTTVRTSLLTPIPSIQDISSPTRYNTFGFAEDEYIYVPKSSDRPETDKEKLWTLVLSEWDDWNDGRLQYLIICEGISAKYRTAVWKKLAQFDKHLPKECVENCTDNNCTNIQNHVYTSLLSNNDDDNCKQIQLDLTRTFANHYLFKREQGRQRMFNVLKAYSFYNPSIGYCQGMSFVCGCLLMIMSEEEAFWTLVALMDKVGLYYTPSMEGIISDNAIFDQLLKIENPTVYNHLKKYRVETLVFVSRWFLVLFTDLPNWHTVLRLWDVIFFEGRKGCFRIALAIINICSSKLMAQEGMEKILPFLLAVPADLITPHELLTQVFLTEIDKLLEKVSATKVPGVVFDMKLIKTTTSSNDNSKNNNETKPRKSSFSSWLQIVSDTFYTPSTSTTTAHKLVRAKSEAVLTSRTSRNEKKIESSSDSLMTTTTMTTTTKTTITLTTVRNGGTSSETPTKLVRSLSASTKLRQKINNKKEPGILEGHKKEPGILEVEETLMATSLLSKVKGILDGSKDENSGSQSTNTNTNNTHANSLFTAVNDFIIASPSAKRYQNRIKQQ